MYPRTLNISDTMNPLRNSFTRKYQHISPLHCTISVKCIRSHSTSLLPATIGGRNDTSFMKQPEFSSTYSTTLEHDFFLKISTWICSHRNKIQSISMCDREAVPIPFRWIYFFLFEKSFFSELWCVTWKVHPLRRIDYRTIEWNWGSICCVLKRRKYWFLFL